jgi:hypothetical protein
MNRPDLCIPDLLRRKHCLVVVCNSAQLSFICSTDT